MALVEFGNRVDFSSASILPEPGSVLIGYDLDGILKQKDEFGVIKPISSAESLPGTLSETLLKGNSTGTSSILLDSSIRPGINGSILLTSNGGYTQSYIHIDQSQVLLSSLNRSISLQNNNILIDYDTANSILIGTSSFILKLNNNNALVFTTGNVKVSGNRIGSILSSEFSSINSGVVNSSIIGGSNLTATQSNTVYLGNSVNINNAYTLPNTTGLSKQVLTSNGIGGVDWGSLNYNFFNKGTLNNAEDKTTDIFRYGGIFIGLGSVSSTDRFAVSTTNGTVSLVVNGNGDVGINITNPTQSKFTIRGTGTGTSSKSFRTLNSSGLERSYIDDLGNLRVYNNIFSGSNGDNGLIKARYYELIEGDFQSGGSAIGNSVSNTYLSVISGSFGVIPGTFQFTGKVNYKSDYSAYYTDRTLVDKGYITSVIDGVDLQTTIQNGSASSLGFNITNSQKSTFIDPAIIIANNQLIGTEVKINDSSVCWISLNNHKTTLSNEKTTSDMQVHFPMAKGGTQTIAMLSDIEFKADLVNGIVPTTQLPSFVDAVQEFSGTASFPVTGSASVIYVDTVENKAYRWSGTQYIYITSGAVDSVNGQTGVVLLTATSIGLGMVDNTSDLDKPISTQTQMALNNKSNIGHTHSISHINGLQGYLDNKSNIGHTHSISDTIGLQTALDGKSNIGHTHSISHVIGLQTALDGKSNIGHTHSISDTIGLQTTLDGKSNIGHTHSISDTIGLQTVLDNKSNIGHTHSISHVIGLQTALDGKSNIGHTHSISDTIGLQTTLDGKSNIGHTHSQTEVTGLTVSLAGKQETLVSGTNIKTINGNTLLGSGDLVISGGSGAVTSVNGKTGSVVLDKTDIGLSNVDNTSDLDKPVSTAQQTALDGKSNLGHTHSITDITNPSNFFLSGTTSDAFNSKTQSIYRPGALLIGTGSVSELDRFVVSSTNGTVSLVVDESGNVYNRVRGDVSSSSYGNGALVKNTTGSFNAAFGASSLNSNTTGSFNLAIGGFSLFNNVSGTYNVAVGLSALQNNNGTQNMAIGAFALNSNVSGERNTGIGTSALQNTNSSRNTAIGNFALATSNGGSGNTSIGSFAGSGVTTGAANTLIGGDSTSTGAGISSGSNNTIVGNTVTGITTGSNNTIIGKVTGLTNSSLSNTIIVADGSNNIRLFVDQLGNLGIGTTSPSTRLHISGTAGSFRLENTTQGNGFILVSDTNGVGSWTASSNIVASGGGLTQSNFLLKGTTTDALNNKTGAIYRTGELHIGTASINSNDRFSVSSTGGTLSFVVVDNTNVGIGTTTPTARLDVSGADMVVHGVRVGRGLGSISTNTAVGNGALISNTSGTQNTALGFDALRNNTTATFNTAIGHETLRVCTSGGFNTAVGNGALRSNTLGDNNTAIGSDSLTAVTTGSGNVSVGVNSQSSNLTGVSNVSLGISSLSTLTSGNQNVAIGAGALRNLTSNFSSVAVGSEAGSQTVTATSVTSANDSLFIGANTKPLANSQSNQIVIGFNTNGLGSNTVVLGNDLIVTTALKGNVGIGTTSPTARFHISGTAGSFRLENTTQGNGFVLVSDTNGVGSWTASSNIAAQSNFLLKGTTTDALNNKTGAIYRTGELHIGTASINSNDRFSVSSTGGTLSFVVDDNTNVGIGKYPVGGSKLNVSGSTILDTTANIGTGLVIGSTTLGQATGNGLLTLYRNQANISFTLGNPVISQNNEITSTNTFGNVFISAGATFSIRTGFTVFTEKFSIGNNGRVLVGTVSNNNLDRLVVSSTGATVSLIVDEEGSVYNRARNNSLTNLAIGYRALRNTTIAGSTDNTAIGYLALNKNVNGLYNTAIGSMALENNDEEENTAVGTFALSSNVSGYGNSALGSQALSSNTIGGQNVAIGIAALQLGTNCETNVAIGSGAMSNANNVTSNVAVGPGALRAVINSIENVSIGFLSMDTMTSGNRNTAIGPSSLKNITSGSGNIAIGYLSGSSSTISTNSIFIGNLTRPNANSETNQIVIGENATGAGSNTVTLGNTSVVRTLLRGSVSMGGAPSDTSAILRMDSTTQGLLVPRMTTTQINAITSPSIGLLVYNTTINTLCFYNGTWQRVSFTAM